MWHQSFKYLSLATVVVGLAAQDKPATPAGPQYKNPEELTL